MLRDVGTGILGLAVLAGFWAVMLVFGAGFPVFGAMHLLYSAGYIAHDPMVPDVAWTLGRGMLWAALGLALLSRVGRDEYAQFMVLLLITWFGAAFFLPLVGSALITLPVHAVVSPVFGIDANGEWRPVLHAVMAVLGAIWGIKVVADSFGGEYDVGAARHAPSSGTSGTLGSLVETAMHAMSKNPDDGGWSDDSGDSGDSGGGDSD